MTGIADIVNQLSLLKGVSVATGPDRAYSKQWVLRLGTVASVVAEVPGHHSRYLTAGFETDDGYDLSFQLSYPTTMLGTRHYKLVCQRLGELVESNAKTLSGYTINSKSALGRNRPVLQVICCEEPKVLLMRPEKGQLLQDLSSELNQATAYATIMYTLVNILKKASN